jgi:hypothetical protein
MTTGIDICAAAQGKPDFRAVKASGLGAHRWLA